MIKQIWTTNGTENKRIRFDSKIQDGWRRGRSNVHSEASKLKIKEAPKKNNPEKRKQTMLERYGTFLTKRRKNAIKVKNDERLEIIRNTCFENKSIKEKRKQVLHEQNYKCGICLIDNWMNSKIVFELHHINGNNKDNSRDNLIFLCPNCHSQTDFWRKRKASLCSPTEEAGALGAS